MSMHGLLYHDFRHDLFHVCVYIAANSLLANILPPRAIFRGKRRAAWVYGILVYFVALSAGNLRGHLPSLGAWWHKGCD